VSGDLTDSGSGHPVAASRRTGWRIVWHLALVPPLGVVFLLASAVLIACGFDTDCIGRGPRLSRSGPMLVAVYALALLPAGLAAVLLDWLGPKGGAASWLLAVAVVGLAMAFAIVVEFHVILDGLLGFRLGTLAASLPYRLWFTTVAAALIVEAIYRWRSAQRARS